MADAPSSRRFRSQKLDLHYADWGADPDLPTLILMHGGNDHCRSWDPVARALSDRFHVVCPDLRGHGDSGWSDDGSYSINAHVYDLAEFYRALGIASAAILAHSFGGAVALRYAGLYPETVSRLIVIEGLGRGPEAERDYLSVPVEQRILQFFDRLQKADAATPRPYNGIAEAAERLRAHNTRLDPDFALHLAEHGTRLDDEGKRRWKYDVRARARAPLDLSPEERRRLRWQVSAPILLVEGTDSAGADLRPELTSDFADARRLVIEEAGHWVHHDRRETFIEAARAFLLAQDDEETSPSVGRAELVDGERDRTADRQPDDR